MDKQAFLKQVHDSVYSDAVNFFEKKAEPTEGQKKAGNYKKKHIRYNGMEISIENPAGSKRRGKSPDGKEWSSHMYHHYGYIRGTMGRDKDHIDVFIKPGTKETEKVYVVNQNDGKGKFDEHKCMLGFTTKIAAKRAYLMNYEKGWDGAGSVIEMPIDLFKKWVYSSRKMKPAKEMVMEKQALLESVYNSAFSDELEKTAGKGSFWKLLTSPGGNTGRMSKELSRSTLGKRQAIRSSANLDELEEAADSAREAYKSLKYSRTRQGAQVEQFGKAGWGERLLRGRLGTKSRRVRKLDAAKGELAATEKQIPIALKNQRSAIVKHTTGKRKIKPKLEAVEKEFKGKAREIRTRQFANVAARSALVGGGVAGTAAIANKFNNRNSGGGYYQ